MTVKLLLCVLISFVILTKCGYCQICTKHSMEIVMKQESYTYTYTETYKTRCWYRDCTKSRKKMNRAFRTVPSRRTITIKECCPGYIREDKENDTISCKAICVPACLNGLCSNPGECSCFEGYSPRLNNTHECQPVCDKECVHGSCVAPKTCSCNFGYGLLNNTCQPICTEPCENGICSAPDTCECLPGYRDLNGSCEPYCSRGCTHGVCIEPEVCQCDPGYKEEDKQCVPNCEQDCGNGTCVGPNICLCNPGFIYQDDTCGPVCNKSCGSGTCVGPEICECDPGYDVQNGTCQAICTNCTNGDCIGPETCKCHPGYANANNSKPCTPLCINCRGSCIAPNKCIYELPLIPKNDTATNSDCDGFENGTDTSKKCEKTIYNSPDILQSSSEIPKYTINDNDTEYEYYDAEDYDKLTQKYAVSTQSFTNTIIDYNGTVMNAKRRTKDNNWFFSTGIYVAVAVIVVLLILLVTWVVARKFFTGSSYVVEDDSHIMSCTSSRPIDLKLPDTEELQKSV